MSSQRKGVKYLIFAEFSRKKFYPSISRQREGQKIQSFHKNFSLIFNCWLFSDFGQFIFVDFLWSRKRAKQKSLYTDIKESAGTLLSLQNDVLCNGFEIQRRDCFAPTHSMTVPKSIEWRWRYFLLAYRRHWAAFAANLNLTSILNCPWRLNCHGIIMQNECSFAKCYYHKSSKKSIP